MIDKIEIIPEPGKSFGKKFMPIANELRSNPRFAEFRPSKLYLARVDLRPHGFDAEMHVQHKRYGTHKLELLETGKKSIDQMAATIEDLLEGNPMTQRVSRIDLCVDVPGVPFSWFREHIRVKRKQWIAEHGEISEMGKGKFQTHYWGKRPCCLRIYDKVTERMVAYERWKRSEIRAVKKTHIEHISVQAPEDREEFLAPELPSFLEWLAYELPITENAEAQPELPGLEQPHQLSFPIVTRVENQMGGRVPGGLKSLHLVRKNAPDYNPFDGLELLGGRQRFPDLWDRDQSGRFVYSVTQFLAGLGVQALAQRGETAQMIWNMINRDRNGKRIQESLRDFLPADVPGITTAELFDRYHDSVSQQLAA